MQKALTILKYLMFIGLGLGILFMILAGLNQLGHTLFNDSQNILAGIGGYTLVFGVFLFIIYSALALLHHHKNHPLGIFVLILSAILLVLFIWAIPNNSFLTLFSILLLATPLLALTSLLLTVSSSSSITKHFKRFAITTLVASIFFFIIAIIFVIFNLSPLLEIFFFLFILSLFCGVGSTLFTWLSLNIANPSHLLPLAGICLLFFIIGIPLLSYINEKYRSDRVPQMPTPSDKSIDRRLESQRNDPSR